MTTRLTKLIAAVITAFVILSLSITEASAQLPRKTLAATPSKTLAATPRKTLAATPRKTLAATPRKTLAATPTVAPSLCSNTPRANIDMQIRLAEQMQLRTRSVEDIRKEPHSVVKAGRKVEEVAADTDTNADVLTSLVETFDSTVRNPIAVVAGIFVSMGILTSFLRLV